MRLALAVGWLAFVYFLAFASPAHFWLDSGEIGAAGVDLGVMHPPGAPGYTLLLRAATCLPLGSLGFRMALVSSALAGATVGGVVALLQSRGTHAWIAVGAAAWLVAGGTFVRQARVVEIYALEGALIVVVLWGFAPVVDAAVATRRRLLGTLAAVWAAWCFGDMRLALVVPVAAAWAMALRRGYAWARWAPLAVALGSAVVLALPLASARGPLADWGNPETFAAAWDHVMAGSIRRAYAEQIWPDSWARWQLGTEAALGGLADDLGPLGPSLGLCAVVALWWRPAKAGGERNVALALGWLVAVELLYAIAINPMGVKDRQTGFVVAVLLAVAVAELLRRHVQPRGRAVWAVVPIAFVVLAVPAALRSAPDAHNTRSWGPHSWQRGVLAQLPPRTLLLTQSDDLAAGSLNARVLEGARPDVLSIPAQHLYKAPSEATLSATGAAGIWAAAAKQDTEAGRIVAAIGAHTGPVAVEGATVALMREVPFWSDRGALPLRVAAPSVAAAQEVPEPETLDESLARWSARLPAPEDRRRLAWALANDARGRVRVYQDHRGAKAQLEAVTRRVSATEAGVWVALGALQDRFGETAAAVASTRKALALEPDRRRALTNLSLYLARDRATLEEAQRWARRAVELHPGDPTAWVRLGTAAELQGNAKAAADARRRMQELLD